MLFKKRRGAQKKEFGLLEWFSSIIFIQVEKLLYQIFSQPSMEPEDGPITKNRDFACACGKRYFSYAALFTHIKQKHDGKAPGPIVRPRSQRKRGRPRKTPLPGSENKNSDSEDANHSNGFLGANEGNPSAQQSQKKTKKAAEMLLGSGSFQAFQAYRGDLYQNDEMRGVPLRKVASQGENIRRKELKLDRKESSMQARVQSSQRLSYQQVVNQEQKQFIQSHNNSLKQLFSQLTIKMSEQQLLSTLQQRFSLLRNKSEASSSKTIIGSLNNYLEFIDSTVNSEQRLLASLILSLFVQFLEKNKLGKSDYSIVEFDRDRAFQFANQFVSALEQLKIDEVVGLTSLQLAASHPKKFESDSEGVPKSDFPVWNLATDILILYSYWVRISDTKSKKDREEPHNYKVGASLKPIKRKGGQSESRVSQAEKELNELMRIQRHRHGQPRIINTIEDIIAVNQSDSQQYNQDKQQQEKEGEFHQMEDEGGQHKSEI